MGTVIIFALVALLALYGMVRSLREKNILGFLFGLGALAVFGWFTVMTVLHHGFPTGTH
jgi:drug/metabolite transporter (DMT)-like permease